MWHAVGAAVSKRWSLPALQILRTLPQGSRTSSSGRARAGLLHFWRRRIGRPRFGDKAAAGECEQDAFERACRKWPGWQPIPLPRHGFIDIAVNTGVVLPE